MEEIKSKLLIIDDEEVVLDSCTQILEGGPYYAATAMDGTFGLELVREFHPDIVFVDLKMPGISGFEVLEKIAEFDPTIVTVVITGYATVDSACCRICVLGTAGRCARPGRGRCSAAGRGLVGA